MRRIRQHYCAEISGCRSSPDSFRISFRNEVWKAARVVDVCVRENDRVESLDWHRELTVLVGRILSLSLKHLTPERACVAIYKQQVTRARHFPCRADKRYLQTASLLLPHRVERGWGRAARPETSSRVPSLLSF